MSEEKINRIVCALASNPEFFPDDVFGECSVCGERVRFRPHVPSPRVLVCVPCFCELFEETTDEIKITPETIRELRDGIKKHSH